MKIWNPLDSLYRLVRDAIENMSVDTDYRYFSAIVILPALLLLLIMIFLMNC